MTSLCPLTYATGGLREKYLPFVQAMEWQSQEWQSQGLSLELQSLGRVSGWKEGAFKRRNSRVCNLVNLTVPVFQHFLRPWIVCGCLLSFWGCSLRSVCLPFDFFKRKFKFLLGAQPQDKYPIWIADTQINRKALSLTGDLAWEPPSRILFPGEGVEETGQTIFLSHS